MADSEHSPSPQESRGIYGFVLFVGFFLCIVFYLLWVIIPAEWSATWPYEPPQKYWAAAVPIFFCTVLFLFAFCIYPALHSLHDGELNELSAVTDSNAVTELEARQQQRQQSAVKLGNNQLDPIAPAFDLNLDDVCHHLYFEQRMKPKLE